MFAALRSFGCVPSFLMASVYHAACTEAGTRELSCVEEALDSGDDVLQCAKSGAQDLDVTAIAATLTQVNPFTAIDLSSNELGAGAAASLKNLLAEEQGAKITSLDLSHNNLSEVAVESLLAGLQGNTTLRELRLSGNPVRGAGALMLAGVRTTGTLSSTSEGGRPSAARAASTPASLTS